MAVVLAFVASAAVFLYLQGVKKDAKAAGGDVMVVVARNDIPAGTDLSGLSTAKFATVSVPRDALVRGAVTDLVQLKGKVTSVQILAGEQISTARLQGQELNGGVYGIPRGFQAVTVSLEAFRVAGGALQQGDHVSVYGSLQPLNGRQDSTTVELVPDALVLKVDAPQAGTSALGSHTGGSNETLVTLALTADQAEKLMFSQEFGHVWLTLLPPGQPGTQVPPVTFSKVAQ